MLFSSPAIATPESTGNPLRLADYEPLAKICSSFLFDLFSPPSHTLQYHDALPYFIAMVLYHSQLPELNALAALTLLQRLKFHHPNRTFSLPQPKCNEAERLFLSSYIAATKVLSDDRYRLQFWVKVSQNKFGMEELALMEKEFFEELDWDVRIDDATLAIFQLLVKRRKEVFEENGRSRSGSTESYSSSDSSESSGSWGFSSSGTPSPSSSSSSSSSSFPPTPPDSCTLHGSFSPTIIEESMFRMRQSEQNLTALDQHIDALQQQFDTMMQKSAAQTQGDLGKPHHGTRHMIKEKFLHAFRSS